MILLKGRIKQSLSGYYDILVGNKEYRTRARGNFRKKKLTPLVGDWVDFKNDDQNDGYVLKIYPRKNELIRPPVANIDAAIVVTACVEPTFSTNLLDRQLIMLEDKNIKPILYFSKADLLNESQQKEFKEYIDYYSRYYACYINFDIKEQGIMLEKLLTDLRDQVVVVMGQTGAGKSTLLNKLDGKLDLETGEISKALSRGKHTTRKVTLLNVKGCLIADTPGFSSFEILDMTKARLPLLYPDFVKYQDNCKFRGCLHVNEPKCEVKKAVENNDILKSRYENYLQFHKMIINQKIKYR